MVSPRRRLPAPLGTPARPAEPPPEIPEWLEQVRITVEREPPLIKTLMMRSINAVLEFAALSEDSVVNATAAPTNLTVLVRALSSKELLDDLRAAEPLAPAFIRGIEAKHRLIEDHGGTLTAEQVGESLGITRQAVEKRRRGKKLIALFLGRHGYRYPVWQFTGSKVLPGFEKVLAALALHDEWMQVAFFVSENPRLGKRTPIEMLKAGALDRVLDAAEVYGEHGAA
jgi:hypothetical protein